MSAGPELGTETTRSAVEALYAAGASLDLDGFLGVLADDAQVHEPTCLPYGGTYTGHTEIQKLFGHVNDHLDLTSIVVDGIVVEGTRAVATVRITSRAGGAEMLAQEVHEVRDGKVVDLRIFFFDPTPIAEGAA